MNDTIVPFFKIKPIIAMTAAALSIGMSVTYAQPLGSAGEKDGTSYDVNNSSPYGIYKFTNQNGAIISNINTTGGFTFNSVGDLTLSNTCFNAYGNNISISSSGKITFNGFASRNAFRAGNGKNITLTTINKDNDIEISLDDDSCIQADSIATNTSTISLNGRNITIKHSSEDNQNNKIIVISGNSEANIQAKDKVNIGGNVEVTAGQRDDQRPTIIAHGNSIVIGGAVHAGELGQINLTANTSITSDSVNISGGGIFEADAQTLTINNGLHIEHASKLEQPSPSKFIFSNSTGTLLINGQVNHPNYSGYSVILSDGVYQKEASATAQTIELESGLLANTSQSKVTFSASDSITVGSKYSNEIALNAIDAASVNLSAAKIDLNGATKATNGGSISLTGPNDTTTQATITGDIIVDQGSRAVLKAGAGSNWTGAAPIQKDHGHIDITMNGDSNWNLTGDSALTALTMENGTIDFGYQKPVQTRTSDQIQYRKLSTNTFSGEGSTLRMRVDLGQESADKKTLDQMSVTQTAIGKLTADLQLTVAGLDPSKLRSNNWLISQGENSKLTLLNREGKNAYSGNGMVTTWGLAFIPDSEENRLHSTDSLDNLVNNPEGIGAGKWYLVRTDDENTDPTPDPEPDHPTPDDPSEIQQITNFGISAVQAMSFASELDDLRTRLGEIRFGAQDGAWVRAGYAKESADGYNGRGFEQKTHDLHIGLDHLVATNDDSSWLFGGAFRYAMSKQEGFTAARGGEGELEQYSAKLYATYMHDKGSYADFIVQAGHYSQDITGIANDLASAFTASYKTYGYGASVEIGHMFTLGEDVGGHQRNNHCFVEPQIQLSYFYAQGKDYQTSTGLNVSQNNADFLTGRAGIVVGKKFNYGTVDDWNKRYFQIGLKGGVKYEFMGEQTIRVTGVEHITKSYKANDVDGARYYYGFVGDFQLSDNFRAYASIEREEGDHYTKDFDVSVGVKYQF